MLFKARGGVENTRLEVEAKNTKKSKAKDTSSEDRPSRVPRTEMLKAKDQGHNAKVFSKNKVFAQNFRKFFRNLKNQKKVFAHKFAKFQQNSSVKNFFCKFSGVLLDETILLMTLAYFQPVKNQCCP